MFCHVDRADLSLSGLIYNVGTCSWQLAWILGTKCCVCVCVCVCVCMCVCVWGGGSVSLFRCISVCACAFLFVCLSVSVSLLKKLLCLSVCLSVCLSLSLSLSSYLSVCLCMFEYVYLNVFDCMRVWSSVISSRLFCASSGQFFFPSKSFHEFMLSSHAYFINILQLYVVSSRSSVNNNLYVYLILALRLVSFLGYC